MHTIKPYRTIYFLRLFVYNERQTNGQGYINHVCHISGSISKNRRELWLWGGMLEPTRTQKISTQRPEPQAELKLELAAMGDVPSSKQKYRLHLTIIPT